VSAEDALNALAIASGIVGAAVVVLYFFGFWR
jgi:hypothetical protein